MVVGKRCFFGCGVHPKGFTFAIKIDLCLEPSSIPILVHSSIPCGVVRLKFSFLAAHSFTDTCWPKLLAAVRCLSLEKVRATSGEGLSVSGLRRSKICTAVLLLLLLAKNMRNRLKSSTFTQVHNTYSDTLHKSLVYLYLWHPNSQKVRQHPKSTRVLPSFFKFYPLKKQKPADNESLNHHFKTFHLYHVDMDYHRGRVGRR